MILHENTGTAYTGLIRTVHTGKTIPVYKVNTGTAYIENAKLSTRDIQNLFYIENTRTVNIGNTRSVYIGNIRTVCM